MHRQITIDLNDLQQIRTLDNERFTYLGQHLHELSILVNKDISLTELVNVDFDKLKKVINNIDRMKSFLKIVSLKQIFGINHKPPELPSDYEVQFICNPGKKSSFSGGESAEFVFENWGNKIKIRSKHGKGIYYLSCFNLDDNHREYYDTLTRIKPAGHYLHQWFEIKDQTVYQVLTPVNYNTPFSERASQKLNINESIYHTYYSPDGNFVVYEGHSDSFPIEALIKNNLTALFSNPYYQEIFKDNELASYDYSYKKLRTLPGMTEYKLRILTDALSDKIALLNLKITIEELVLLDDKRLAFMINHAYLVKDALDFVDKKELLGSNNILNLTLSYSEKKSYSPTLHKPKPIMPRDEKDDDVALNFEKKLYF